MRLDGSLAWLLTFLFAAFTPVTSIALDVDDPNSIKSVARDLVGEIFFYYTGNTTGIPGRYGGDYWWQAGALMGAMIDYWFLTGDAGNNPTVTQALLHQVGDDRNYEPRNVTKELGNDDQAFWALAVLAAAERNFPNPPPDQPQWIPLAQAVFARQTERWDTENCGGGLRWQVIFANPGYNYKNTVSNGLYFLIGARLARFTGNDTYAELAERSYDWMVDVGFLSKDYRVYDGADVLKECHPESRDNIQWSYNAGIILAGCAVMYDVTQDEKWKERLQGYLEGTEIFFKEGVMVEVACERLGTCNGDQRSFKAYLARFFALTLQLAPWTKDYIMPRLRTSALAAARQCDAGRVGKTCGMRWTQPTSDQSFEFGILGQTLAVLEVVQNLLIEGAKKPAMLPDGTGTSPIDPNPGARGSDYKDYVRDLDEDPIGTGEKAAAVIVTILACGFVAGLAWFVITDRGS